MGVCSHKFLETDGYMSNFDNYGQPVGMPEHPDATTVLVLGLVGLFVCVIAAPFAWIKGNKAMADVEAGRYAETSSLKIGRLLGMIGTIFAGASLIIGLLIIIMGVVLSL